MRIAASLGGKLQYTASLEGAGFLSAHLNLANRPKESVTRRVIRVQGYDTNSPTETVSLSGPKLSSSLRTGRFPVDAPYRPFTAFLRSQTLSTPVAARFRKSDTKLPCLSARYTRQDS